MDKIDYAAALRECGFDSVWVAQGVRRVERERRDGAYLGFRHLLAELEIGGGHALRAHHIEPVVRRVESQEAAVQLAERFAGSRLRVAATAAAVREDERAEAEAFHARMDLMRQLLEEVTDDEFDGRVPLRPHIAEAMQQLAESTPVSTQRVTESAP